MTDTTILPAANALLGCLEAELLLNPDPPGSFCLRAGDFVIQDVDGQTSQDKVCCPGLGYVRFGAAYPSSNFPAADVVTVKCFPVAWAVQLTMGVVRCVPKMGTLAGPACSDWTLAAEHDANDFNAMMKAVCCWERGFLKRGTLFTVQSSDVVMTADCIERSASILLQVPKCC